MTASHLVADPRSRPAAAPDDVAPAGGTQDAAAQGALAADEAARVRQGADFATQADILLRLALDPSVTVRAALVLNPATPSSALGVLARDTDERVRALLAGKLAALAPCLTATEQSRLNRQTAAALGLLIEDTAVRVRAAIAEVVKQMPNAPRELVLRLARDAAIEVSGPVILLSPLLTQADLLALLAANAPAVALAVARRPDLTEDVADAVAETADAVAIQAMLLNTSAQIRESTLDALIARAAHQISWHAPLVRRPRLSPHAAEALSRIIADTLLDELASRADLPEAVTTELRTRLTARLRLVSATRPSATVATADPGPNDPGPNDAATPAGTTVAADAALPDATPTDAPTLTEALADARARVVASRLTEAELLGAAGRGEARLAAAMLAVAADVPMALVERVRTLRSAKGVVSLVWKAGFSMRLAVPLQTLLARLGPGALLAPGPGGAFPLAIEEMRWQLVFLGRGDPHSVLPSGPPSAPPSGPPSAPPGAPVAT